MKNSNSHQKILNIIKYIKTSGHSYSGTDFEIGYHSIVIDGIYYKGQRDCIERLNLIKRELNFKGKNILDIGCCTGGMLFPLSNEIKNGVGIDFNYKNVNTGNRLCCYKKISNLHFYQFDLEKENLQFIRNFYDEDIDITFLLSICMWINNWESVIDFVYENSKILVFESNGSDKQQNEQKEYLSKKYKNVKIVLEKSEDDPLQKNRKLFICSK